MTNLITLLMCLTVIIGNIMANVTFNMFLLKQDRLETITFYSLELIQQEGQITEAIINHTKEKLQAAGFPSIIKDGITYPVIEGTSTKTYKDDADPIVYIHIKYPASTLTKFYLLLGGSADDPGYHDIYEYGRSEEL